MNVLVLIAVAIVFILSGVASYMQWRVHQMRKQQLQGEQELKQQIEQKRTDANDSIQIVSRAYLQGQVDTAEACLRLCGLMDQLSVPSEVRSEFVHIAKMADAIRHIPILDEWRALPKKQKLEFQNTIQEKEQEHKQGVEADVKKLVGREF